MTPALLRPYPGELATPGQIRGFAEEYRAAALLLRKAGRRGKSLSHASFRLYAIQSIELYLNALLLHRGYDSCKLRGLQHDLVQRTDLVLAAGLWLKAKTAAHLKTMGGNREYLVSRYGPEMTGTT